MSILCTFDLPQYPQLNGATIFETFERIVHSSVERAVWDWRAV